ncbi:MAG: UvrB/UvrC motif-containing protein [Spirochaetota bacterium]
MLCDICSEREAVIQVQRTWGRQTDEMNVCDVCAAQIGIDPESKMPTPSVEELISGAMSGNAEDEETARCEACGRSYREIRNTGRLGCAQCYAVFENEIRSVLERRPSPAQHAGKYPERLKVYKRFFIDRERLRRRLEAAVTEEDYEQAAKLRDELAHIDREVEDV